MALGCWRDLAVISRELRKFADAEAQFGEAIRTLGAIAETSIARPASPEKGGEKGGGAGGGGGNGDGNGGGGGGSGDGPNDADSMRVELRLCLADALRDQARRRCCSGVVRSWGFWAFFT